MLGDALDRAALAGRVATLEDRDDPRPRVGDPLLHLHELLLQPEELALVHLVRELLLAGPLAFHRFADHRVHLAARRGLESMCPTLAAMSDPARRPRRARRSEGRCAAIPIHERPKPRMRGRLHQGAFVASIPAGLVLVLARARRPRARRDPGLRAHPHRSVRRERVLSPGRVDRGGVRAHAPARSFDDLRADRRHLHAVLPARAAGRARHGRARRGVGRRGRRGRDEALPRRPARAVGVHVHRARLARRREPARAACAASTPPRRCCCSPAACSTRSARSRSRRTGPTRGPARSATTRCGTRPRSWRPRASTCRSCSSCSACGLGAARRAAASSVSIERCPLRSVGRPSSASSGRRIRNVCSPSAAAPSQ